MVTVVTVVNHTRVPCLPRTMFLSLPHARTHAARARARTLSLPLYPRPFFFGARSFQNLIKSYTAGCVFVRAGLEGMGRRGCVCTCANCYDLC